MSDELIPGANGDLVEKIGQDLTPVVKAGDDSSTPAGMPSLPTPAGMPSLPTPGGLPLSMPGAAKQEEGTGQWHLQFNYEKPEKLTMMVEVTTLYPGTTRMKSEISKDKVSRLVEWLNRVLGNIQEF